MGEGSRERIDILVEVFAKSKVCKGCRERIDILVEVFAKSKMSKGCREIIYILVEIIAKSEVCKRCRKHTRADWLIKTYLTIVIRSRRVRNVFSFLFFFP